MIACDAEKKSFEVVWCGGVSDLFALASSTFVSMRGEV